LQSEHIRFKKWAQNAGAHRSDRLSLEYRLREASRLKEEVMNIMGELNDTLSEAIDVIAGNREPYDAESDSEIDHNKIDGTKLTTELEERYIDITHFITCLYMFSIAARNPAPRDKFEKWAAIDVSGYHQHDIMHVRDKFPNASNYLQERLGKANSRRRQLLLYNERHNSKICQLFPIHKSSKTTVQTTDSQLDLDIKTTVTTIYNQNFPWTNEELAEESPDCASVTSYTSSISEGSNTLHVPPPPDRDLVFEGMPFICPYCFAQAIVQNESLWKSHVYQDIRPYVCTFEDCTISDHLFKTRHQWFNHEMDEHRREWFCNASGCQKVFEFRDQFENHVTRCHSEMFAQNRINGVIDQCERPINSEQSCPLCSLGVSISRLRSHLGHHLQQVALFVLRGSSDGDIDINENGEEDEEDEDEMSEVDDDSQKSPGKDHSSSLDNAYSMALGFYKRGEYNKALGWYQRALDGQEKALGKDHPDTLRTVQGMAIMFYQQGKYDEAMEWYQRALDGQEKALGRDHPDTLRTANDMASVFRRRGKYDEAMKWYQRALDGLEKALGKNHPDTLCTVQVMANVFRQRGKYDEAMELYQRALNGLEKVLGKNHPDTLRTVQGMANVFRQRGKYDEAMEWYQRALDGQEKALGRDHPDTLRTVQGMANVFRQRGKYDEAIELYHRALDGLEKVLGKNHPDTLRTVQGMANVFRQRGKYDEAMELYYRALDGQEKALGRDHPDTLRTVQGMATMFRQRGKYDEAMELYQRALDGQEKALGKNHPDTLHTVQGMANVFRQRGKYDEAMEWYQRALDGQEKALGRDHPDTLRTVQGMATVF
ncbi:hypothetical protein BDD12DRAFT_648095, partial [Trichophaea hybrida]